MTTISIMEDETDLQMQQDSQRNIMVFVRTLNAAIFLQDVSWHLFALGLHQKALQVMISHCMESNVDTENNSR